ncbi:ImmA/IrrE family metallo-endopeptidase [Streptococcus canis]|uniref:ImmA/IrrE family metallo-endopeptidase n=2 Tax=Streptococcus canis TaxID=1329 RepID=UPI00116AD6AF|nr:ImmA/IrrE family metallo-endopeptidase [Streptococcus canis]QKG76884.1 ImmA/IrrE family metallo-endopeptidase [Streptococcus canis]GEE06491.1 hypothetical protein ScOT1_05840 [Streptococcus canis]GFG41158.1 hypothetical protein ScFU29_00630 [Streptococcus canis]GMX35328.1 hypothetical protein SpKU43_04060 [Streptococcus canis]GMX39201.1 hypothetical protein ScKU71_04240 [Streptococcus canis]
MTPYSYAVQTAKELVYKYMKLNDIKSKYYNYHSFFEHYCEKLNILTIESKLHQSISGFSIINRDDFPSIFYQKEHPKTRQNFTKCHELGHILLNHEGHIFTENNGNINQEHEANYFAGFILAPDIVLLYKIVYENKLFKEITIDLEISKECLEIRLFHLLKDYSNLNNKEISTIVSNFQRNKNQDINLALYDVKHNIISEYKQITPTNLEKAIHQLNKSYLISSLEFIELTDNIFQEKLKQSNSNLLFDSYFDFGKNTFYCWDTNYLTKNQVLSKVKTLLFEIHFLNKKIKLGK